MLDIFKALNVHHPAMQDEWQHTLSMIVEKLGQPTFQGLLITDHHTIPSSEQWTTLSFSSLSDYPFTQRFDIAICILSTYSPQTIQHITRCRDVLARRLFVIVPDTVEPAFNGIALGFVKLAVETPDNTKQHATLWSFNILDYKQVPDWLNAKFWANPENWNKYRW